jgi:dipeptidyl aminopeptidase/acylaminoacyl peptidase
MFQKTLASQESTTEELIEQIIDMHYQQFLNIAISPDDEYALVTFGNYDVLEEHYLSDILNRSIWNLRLRDGEAMQLVGSEEDAHAPCWSPDGQEIAYLSRQSGKTEIWIMDRYGCNKRKLTDSQASVTNPFDGCRLVWSPNGQHIAYTYVPNGSRQHLNLWYAKNGQYGQHQDIIIHKHRKQDNKAFHDYISSKFVSQVYVVETLSGEIKKLSNDSSRMVEVIGWLADDRLLIGDGNDLKELDTATSQMKDIYCGSLGLTKISGDELFIARLSDNHIEFGYIKDGQFMELGRSELPGTELILHCWSNDGSQLFATSQQGVSNVLYFIDTISFMAVKLTDDGNTVYNTCENASGPVCCNQDNSIIFAYGGPANPKEIWKREPDGSLHQISYFNKGLASSKLPKTQIIEYTSDGWIIEALLVLPIHYVPGQTYPTLVYLHGGPEGNNHADFNELISAGQSAAHFLASHGYAVLLPNFRGSSGYGQEFQNQLGNYQLMRNPYKDIMAGIDVLIDQGIADPEALGIYGFSYGAGLATWTVSQTQRFKGAIGVCGIHDILQWDKDYCVPFYSFRPNRRGGTDPKDLWLRPEIYKELSPLENVSSINTPILLIETGAERRWDGAYWESWAKTFFNALCTFDIETYLVCYAKASHAGGWNDNYKRDYLNRVLVWFDYCLKGKKLPDWF